ncbi:hypothetical protein GCM10020370_12350 [Paenibacillus hodogayensis]
MIGLNNRPNFLWTIRFSKIGIVTARLTPISGTGMPYFAIKWAVKGFPNNKKITTNSGLAVRKTMKKNTAETNPKSHTTLVIQAPSVVLVPYTDK